MRARESDADATGCHWRGLRTDAARNRDRILAVAQELFGEQGPKASLDEIARRAGIGNATLYRHFPGRHALLAAALERIVVTGADAAEEAATREDDPFAALSSFAQAIARARLAALCCVSDELTKEWQELAQQRERLVHAAQRLLSRAQQAQQIRADISLEEFMGVVIQLSRPLPGTSWSATDQFSPRILQVYLDGLYVEN
ncbi:TetR/AcrR family transcriptional regulator [Streptomyces sp. NPDC057620]|uniref:TetR/AcrR family transcriptional regulator n=1 Tax=Streptomyces sp. NPDC057620 TaxID=3346185 RepID=UPI003698DA34